MITFILLPLTISSLKRDLENADKASWGFNHLLLCRKSYLDKALNEINFFIKIYNSNILFRNF